MEALKALALHVKSRLAELEAEKKKGTKIVGYLPGGYLPEEFILAAGALPLGMIRSADEMTVQKSLEYLCRWFDPFYRGQIGYLTTNDDPYYSILDLLAIAITDTHCRSICDTVEVYTKLDSFQFGVPCKKSEGALEYYVHGLNRLKERLETLTGTKITDEKLRESTRLCNRERELFRELSLMRKADFVPIGFQDYLALHHASFIADKEFMITILEAVISEIKASKLPVPTGPRLLLTASTLAYGDTKVPRLVEEAGGSIVIEDVGECVRSYWHNVPLEGNPIENIAETYFMKRVPPAWFRPGRERLDFVCDLAKEFRVQGVIWYHLMFRESYKMESYYFPKILKEAAGLHMLLLESDYGTTESGTMGTKIDSFVHMLRARAKTNSHSVS